MLDTEINRAILGQALQQRNMQVGQEDINQEISRAAANYGYFGPGGKVDMDRWLQYVTQNDESKLTFTWKMKSGLRSH